MTTQTPVREPKGPIPPRVALNARIPFGLHKEARMQALREGRSLQEIVEDALAMYLRSQEQT